MKSFTRIAGMIVVLVAALSASTANADRRVELLDANWKFLLGDAPEAQLPTLDDAKWRTLDLPHDWSIEQPFDAKLASGMGYLPGGVGWYRKTFSLRDLKPDQHVSIRFDGVYMNARVWINGHDLGTRPNGFVSFEYDLTSHLSRDGKPNVLAVRVDRSEDADSRFYTGSGIYRNVWLITTSPVCIEPWGTFVTTPGVSAANASVRIETAVRNHADQSRSITLLSEIQEADGTTVAKAESSHAIESGQTFNFQQEAIVAKPRRWSIDRPTLYRVVSSIKIDGEAVDQVTTPFGIRSIEFDSNRGFLLNGEKTLIKGICLHQDAGAFGAAVPCEVFERRLRSLKELGCNAIRTSHNPPPPELLDLCDEMGFVVMDEAFDEWAKPKKKWVAGWNQGEPSFQGYSEYFDKWSAADLQSMVKRDRNHPSVVLWSIGNEIDYNRDPYWEPNDADFSPEKPSAADLPATAKKLWQDVKEIDTTRPVTAALANLRTSNPTGLPEALDVVGYNYQEQLYPADHEKNPARRIIGSENRHAFAAWRSVAELPYATGQFLWTGFDYLGEARAFPLHGSPAGLLDECGFKKPAFYFRQSLWAQKPMVYIAVRRASGIGPRPRGNFAPVIPSWTAPANDAPVDVVCYSNCQRVELLLNDKTLGAKPHSDTIDGVLSWQVPFAPGVLKAVGYSGDKASCEYKLVTPGEPDHLALTPDLNSVKPRDLIFVTAEVQDKSGNPIESADHDVHFTVTGAGKIRALDSGDLSSQESFQSNHRRAYHGRCLLIVQAGSESGSVTVRAISEGLAPAEVTIQCAP